MRFRCSALVVLAAVGVLATAAPSAATDDVSTRRLAGPDRYATAAAIARVTFPTRVEGQRSGNPVVARGDAFPDALTGVNTVFNAPVLLTPFGEAPQPTLAVIRDFGAPGVSVMGETDVVSSRVEQQIEQVEHGRGGHVAVRRVAGRDRYETAARSYTQAYDCYTRTPRPVDGMRTAFLTSGLKFADAMAAGPVAAGETVPLLLTAPDRLPAPTRVALAFEGDGPEGAGCGGKQIEQVVVVGGEAVVSAAVAQELRDLGYAVRRIAGATRQETAVRLFEFAEAEFGWVLDHVNLARGDGFADAVAGGPHAGREKAPILLTASAADLGEVTRSFLRSRARTVASLDVFGDASVVSDAVVEDARRAATTGG